MTATTQPDANGLIASLYLWGARCAGGILLVGIAIHVANLFSETASGVVAELGRVWPDVVLIALSAVPVVSLAVAGLNWAVRDRRNVAGWMAVAIALFLSSLWVIK